MQVSDSDKPLNKLYIKIHLFHSDGVGRTGTFISIHAQLERLKTEGVVDFFQFIKSARLHRAGLVSDVVSTVRYKYYYKAACTRHANIITLTDAVHPLP